MPHTHVLVHHHHIDLFYHHICLMNMCYSHFTHCGLVTPYGDKELCHHWFRQWLVAWRHQAIAWTNIDLASVRRCHIHMTEISQQIPHPSIIKISSNITYLKLPSNLPGANELTSVDSLIDCRHRVGVDIHTKLHVICQLVICTWGDFRMSELHRMTVFFWGLTSILLVH